MAAELEPVINVSLWQVQAEDDVLRVVPGISVRQVVDGRVGWFVDPHNYSGQETPATYMQDQLTENVALGVSRELSANITPDHRLISASLPTRLLSPENGLNMGDELDVPIKTMISRVALIGIAERQDLAVEAILPSHGNWTQELDRASSRTGYLAKLIILDENGGVYLRYDTDSRARYSLRYLDHGPYVYVEKIGSSSEPGGEDEIDEGPEGGDEGGGGGGGRDSDDRYPRRPITPAGSASAEAEIEPVEEEDDQPLILVGKEA